MKPARAAIQLSKVWRTIRGEKPHYPVDCRLLAEALNIKVHGEHIDDNFEALLQIRGKLRVIIYNENIRQEGRKNFCIAHEIGHHSCHSEREEFFCSIADLNDLAPHPVNIEQEANFFAANLLMPIDDFRAQISHHPVNLAFLSDLANDRYETSLTATCTRLIDASPGTAYGMVVAKDDRVSRWACTREMRWSGLGFRKGHKVPRAGLNHNPHGEIIDSDIWLNSKNAPRWTLTQSAVHMPYYDQTLILIAADRAEDSDYFDQLDEPDPTPPQIPSFK